MENILAMIHAPGATDDQLKTLVNKLRYFLDRFGLRVANLKLNPPFPLKLPNDNPVCATLVLGWGLPSMPAWDRLLAEYEIADFPQELLAFDLYERRGFNGRPLRVPRLNAGRYWAHRVQKGLLALFLEGYYLRSTAPYGLKCVLRKPAKGRENLRRSHFVLMPGDSDEIEIVKLVFDLFVNHGYSRTQISNLLTAQLVKSPGKTVRWGPRVVKTILEDPVYIGANELKGTIRYDVFPPLIDKSTFYEAQAKIMRERITRDDFQTLNRKYHLSAR